MMRRRRGCIPAPLPLGEMMSDRIMQNTMSIAPLATQARGQHRRTAGMAVRGFCLDCLGAASGRAAFDCGSTVCPLRPATPFLGKPMPVTMRGDNRGEPAPTRRRRPSRALIHAQCRQCQPGDTTDCSAEDCALHAFRPWDGPGKVEKRRPSQKQLAHLESARRLIPAARLSATPIQRPSTAAGQASDG